MDLPEVCMLVLILIVFAFVLSVVAGILSPPPAVGNQWSWKLLCWAMACWFLAEMLARGGSVLKLG